MRYDITIFVPGQPATAGSKTPMRSRRTGKLYNMDSCKGKSAWMLKVATHARQAYQGPPLAGPIFLRMDFFLQRPLDHYRVIKGERILREDAPYWHTSRPDRTKLLRCAEDALVGICWNDDSQVVTGTPTKRWANQPGLLIHVARVTGTHTDDPMIEEILRAAPEPIRKLYKTKPLTEDVF